MDDQELKELFSDPADREVIDLLYASRPATPPLDPHFRSYLRAKLMAQAREKFAAPTRRRWFQLGPAGMAPAMAAVAAGFIIVLGVEAYLHGQPAATQPVAVNLTGLENRKDVATAEPIQIPFSGPVDKTAVEESIVIEPATSFTKHWEGQTLVITPAHPLAPSTTYKVTLQPKAVAPTQAAAPTPAPQRPVVVHFLTAPAPIAPVVPPSFKSGSITYGYDNRIPDSARLSNPAWTLDGQLLVTRPAESASPAASTSPSPGTTVAPPASAAAATNIWLMSTQGTLIRNVAPGGSYPSVAPSGGLFADWSEISDHATLEVRDLQGNVQAAAVATLASHPDRPAVWLGPTRLAYLSEGLLKVVDLHATLIATPAIKVTGAMSAPRSGLMLAMVTDAGPVVLDLSTMNTTVLPAGATGFSWSPTGQLAFTIGRVTGTDLYTGLDPNSARKVAASAAGETWSDLNWSPDSASILLARHTGSGADSHVRLLLVNADGSAPTGFGSNQRDYANPLWSPRGDLVLFSRPDEAGGISLWTAKATVGLPSAADNAESQALAEVDTFMKARIKGDLSGAQAELDPAAQQAYSNGASSLLSPGAQFARYYPVSVQLAGPNKFLIGARLFIARNNVETSFFEEQLTVLLQNQRYLIDAVSATPTLQLGHGPTVVSVEVRQNGSTQQIMIRFDSDLKPETVSAETILVKDNEGSPVRTGVSFDPDGHLVTVDVKLKTGTYSMVVTTGVADINGTQVAQPYTTPLVIGG